MTKTQTEEKTKLSLVDRFTKFAEPLSAIGRQRHLSAMRDGFALSLPITIAGAIAILFITIVFGGWGASKTSLLGLLAHASGNTQVSYSHLYDSTTSWEIVGNFAKVQAIGMQIFGFINSATLGHLTLYLVFLISYSLGVSRNSKSPALVGVVGIATFMVFVNANPSYFGATGMLVGILGALVGSEFFMWIVNSGKMEIKMPAGVPPAVGRAFGIMLPAFLTVFGAAMLNFLIAVPYMAMYQDVKMFPVVLNVVNDIIQEPFMNFAKSGGDIGLLFMYLFLVHFLWFFGIHGPNTINSVMSPIGTLLWVDNMSGGKNVAIDQVWNGFVWMGGSGATLPMLVLAMWFMRKGSPTREVSKFAIPSGIFEINEPVLFGFPITFNFIWFVPFVFGPLVSALWPVMFIKLGWMNAPTLMAPWTTPPVLYGLIVTGFDWRSIIVSLLSFATTGLIYSPFLLYVRSQENKEMALQEATLVEGGHNG